MSWWNLVKHKYTKAPPKKKGEYKEQNGTTHLQEDKKNHLRGQNHKRNINQVPEPPPVERNISNKEREGPPERMTSLEGPSSTATARLKIRLPAHTVIPFANNTPPNNVTPSGRAFMLSNRASTYTRALPYT